jgi:hypothetical protein
MPTFTDLAATDEAVLIECAGDYPTLVPTHQRIASGTDGAVTAGAFALTSAAVNFATRGVAAGCVVVIRPGDPKLQDIGVVESVATTTATLRRVGLATGEGQPFAGATGITGASFIVPTCHPQLRAATRRLEARYPDLAITSAGFAEAAVLMTLIDLYGALFRSGTSPFGGGGDKDNFAAKYKQYRDELTELFARLDATNGGTGTGSATVGFGTIPMLSSIPTIDDEVA